MSRPPNYSFPRPLLLASQLQTYQQARSTDVDSDDSDSDMSLPEINEKQSCIEAEKRRFPYWVCPVVCAFVWFVMNWVLMITWLAQGSPVYKSMNGGQTIAYISDIGASMLKPFFVIGCTITSITFFSSLYAIHRNQRRLETPIDIAAIGAGGLGAVSLILLSILDTASFPRFHYGFLCLFMLGVIFSAIFTTLSYRVLGTAFIERAVLKTSYQIKQWIVIIEVPLAIAMSVLMVLDKDNVAAVLEWLIAFVFTAYVLSFYLELRPRSRTMEGKELLRERSLWERRNRRPISVITSMKV
ncbi:Frag1/DRAM/Sfk1 family-domain-containing protein [Morchella snyderi]|nr:Frag1/DRAM/Sfk1 family-domain-containing protein [Morchella snyderi]